MPTLIPFLSRRVYDFSATIGVTTDVVVVRALDVVQWRQGELLVRVHAVNIAGAGRLNVVARLVAPSADAPQTDFVRTTPVVAQASVAGATAGVLLRVPLTAPFGGHLQLSVSAIPQGGGGALSATLSAALNLRERP